MKIEFILFSPLTTLMYKANKLESKSSGHKMCVYLLEIVRKRER
jgi:hypothetical protein